VAPIRVSSIVIKNTRVDSSSNTKNTKNIDDVQVRKFLLISLEVGVRCHRGPICGGSDDQQQPACLY